MDYRQNTDGCLADTIGQRGLDRETLDAMLARTAPALDKGKVIARQYLCEMGRQAAQ